MCVFCGRGGEGRADKDWERVRVERGKGNPLGLSELEQVEKGSWPASHKIPNEGTAMPIGGL